MAIRNTVNFPVEDTCVNDRNYNEPIEEEKRNNIN